LQTLQYFLIDVGVVRVRIAVEHCQLVVKVVSDMWRECPSESAWTQMLLHWCHPNANTVSPVLLTALSVYTCSKMTYKHVQSLDLLSASDHPQITVGHIIIYQLWHWSWITGHQ